MNRLYLAALFPCFALSAVNAEDYSGMNPADWKVLAETESPKEILRIRQDLAGAQRQFDRVWDQVQKKFASQQAFLAELRKSHKDWLFFRDGKSHTDGETGTYATYSPEESSAFMIRKAVYTRDRSKWLQGLLDTPGTAKDLSGVWWSSMEGAIRFEQTEDEVRFCYHERGGNGHSGITAGIVRWNGRKGVFSAVWGNSPDAEKGKLSFDLENGLLRVGSEGTISQYAGTRVVFEGEFTRVAPLSAKDRDMIASEISFYFPK